MKSDPPPREGRGVPVKTVSVSRRQLKRDASTLGPEAPSTHLEERLPRRWEHHRRSGVDASCPRGRLRVGHAHQLHYCVYRLAGRSRDGGGGARACTCAGIRPAFVWVFQTSWGHLQRLSLSRLSAVLWDASSAGVCGPGRRKCGRLPEPVWL